MVEWAIPAIESAPLATESGAMSSEKSFGSWTILRCFASASQLAKDRESSIFNVVRCKVGSASFRGEFYAQDTGAEALLFGILGIEREPDGGFVAWGDGIEKRFEGGGRIELGVFGGSARPQPGRAP